MLFVLPVLLVFFGCIFLYLRTVWALLERVESDHPEIWREELGSPRYIVVNTGGQNTHTIQPILPFLLWLVRGWEHGMNEECTRLYQRARRLFFASLFLMTIFAWGMVSITG